MARSILLSIYKAKIITVERQGPFVKDMTLLVQVEYMLNVKRSSVLHMR